MYNRYLPQQEEYTPVGESHPQAEKGRETVPGVEQIREMLKKFLPEKLDSGDLLLILILLLLWKEGEDKDLLLALAGAFLLGDT